MQVMEEEDNKKITMENGKDRIRWRKAITGTGENHLQLFTRAVLIFFYGCGSWNASSREEEDSTKKMTMEDGKERTKWRKVITGNHNHKTIRKSAPTKISNYKPIRNRHVVCSSTIDRTVNDPPPPLGINGRRSTTQDRIGHLFRGTLDETTQVFTKHFLVTSYQIGSDSKASLRAIMSILQDTILSHCRASWPAAASGFGVTEEMIERDLIWAFFRTQVFIDSYPSWDDVVQVQSVLRYVPGKAALINEWVIRNHDTGEIIIRAASQLLMMNKNTRKFQKITDRFMEKLKCHLADNNDPILPEVSRIKLPPFDFNSAHEIQTGLVADLGDLDLNQHVNNSKYIEWILKSVPRSVYESHEISILILNFRKECNIKSVVQSSTSLVDESEDRSNYGELEMNHLLRLESGPQVARARTTWRPKTN